MLGRAATNAYSWWWASHIRTKQSKWLEQSLQDMEEIVAETLKIIDDNGDSFAQRAEMYYKKRPELVNFVEEAFRAYRALAERYDHLSKELQSANRTIATVFPDQVHYRIDDDDFDEESVLRINSSSQDTSNQTEKQDIPQVLSIPFPKKEFRTMMLSRKGPLRRSVSSKKSVSTNQSSGLSKVEALSEIDKLQKEILALQTEKEFVRSSYEHSYGKYWEIEDQITGMQKRVCSLQDEFGIGKVIEDNDARVLMAATALNSCKETLAKLQEVQTQSSEEAKAAYERVKEAHDKFETLKSHFISKHKSEEDQETEPKSKDEEKIASLEEEMCEHDVGLLQESIKEKLEEDSISNNYLTMTEVAERIDELVSKVVTLETAVTSQTSLVKRLRSEADELQTNIQSLEEDKEMLIEDSENTNKKMKELEEELKRVKILNQNLKRQENNLQTHFSEANCNLEHLSGRLKNVKLDEEGENLVLYNKKSVPNGKLGEKFEKPEDELSTDNLAITNDVNSAKEDKEDRAANLGDVRNDDDKSNVKENIDSGTDQGILELTQQQDKDDSSETMSNLDNESLDLGTSEENDQSNCKQMFTSGPDDREQILLEKYTSVLKNYKNVNVKLNDAEKKNRNSIFELALQVRELKNVVATKDKEINILQQKLTCPETNPDESLCTPHTEHKYTPQEPVRGNAAEGGNLEGPESLSSNIGSTSFREQHQHVENTGNIGMSSGRIRIGLVRANQADKHHPLSPLEKKFRSDIDDLLEENLEFWLRFSTSVHQIQQFKNSIKDLKAEMQKIKETKISEGNSNAAIQSEIKPIFRHLREIRTELSLWLEHNEVLHEELHGRHPTLCSLQDEIARAAANPDSEKVELSEYQAAKFQGEVLNMKQENNKVSSELEAGLGFVKGLKIEVEKMLDELSQAMGVNNHDHMKHSSSRARMPLRSFLFGIKLKKQRQSMFACVNPTLQKQHSDLAATDDAPI